MARSRLQSPTPQHFSQRDELLQLPRAERRTLLEATVTAEFKSTLLMSVGDELPLNANYFDLGLTSLRVVEIKQRLVDDILRKLYEA
jgi:hypothetical protein